MSYQFMYYRTLFGVGKLNELHLQAMPGQGNGRDFKR